MTRLFVASSFSLAVLVLTTPEALAQNRGGGGFLQQNQTGGFGATQGAFGGTGQSTIGQPGRFGGAQGGVGGQQGGVGGQRGQATRQQQQVGGQDGFVGTDAQQMRDQRAMNPRQRRRAMFDLAIESLNEIRDSRRRQRRNRRRPPPVRVQVRPSFAAPTVSTPELSARVQSQFERTLPSTVGAARVSVSGSTATIEGTAASDYDRQLAAKMLSMQPGITQVDNQISVSSDASAPTLVPAQ